MRSIASGCTAASVPWRGPRAGADDRRGYAGSDARSDCGAPPPVTPRLHNRTRQSASIPRTLLRRGRLLEIPLYYMLRLSDLAREGVERSGSHRFADHIYRNEPSGRGAIGRWLDARLLGLPAVRSFRSRYLAAREEVARAVLDRLHDPSETTIRVLSVP